MRRTSLTIIITVAVALLASACTTDGGDGAIPNNGPLVVVLTEGHLGRPAGATLVLDPDGDILAELPPKKAQRGAGGAIAVGIGRTIVTDEAGLRLAQENGSSTAIVVDPPTDLVLTRLLAASEDVALIDGGPDAPLVLIDLVTSAAKVAPAAGATVQQVYLTESGESAVATSTAGTFLIGLDGEPTVTKISSSLDGRLLADDDLVVVAERGAEASAVRALDLDGTERWRVPVDGLLGLTITGDTIVVGAVGALITFDADGEATTIPVDDGLAPIDIDSDVTLLSGRTTGYWYTFDPEEGLLTEHVELRGKFDLVRGRDRVLFTSAGGDYREITDAAVLDLAAERVDELETLIAIDERAWPIHLGPFDSAIAAVLDDTVRVLPLDEQLPYDLAGELVTFSPDGTRMVVEDVDAEVTTSAVLLDSGTGEVLADLGPATVLAWGPAGN